MNIIARAAIYLYDGSPMSPIFPQKISKPSDQAGEYLSAIADKLMGSARRLSLKWCRRAVVRCGQTDLAMKSTGQDGQELLTTLLLELAAPA